MELKELVEKSLFIASTPEEIDKERLYATLNKYNFALIRGLIKPEVVKSAVSKLKANFDWRKDRPATGEDPQELHSHFQKLSIGGAEQSSVYRPRCMRTFYSPVWSDDIYGLRDAFVKMAKVRNIIYGFDTNFAIDKVENGFWTAARLHHYPAGGGFLVSHKDNVVPIVQAANGINGYFQPILVMAKKGKGEDYDFETGGGFFEHEKKRYYFEEACEYGDIAVYSGNTIHGVSDIDIHKPFRQDNLDGRLCGFVTLYKDFTRKGELADYVKPGQVLATE